jgi:hypothetical protein
MTGGPATTPANWPLLACLLAAGLLLIVAGANAHLFYVALASQPECVTHLKEAGSQVGEYRAAQSAC